eukprot:5678885-Prymnesium_polylepis.1
MPASATRAYSSTAAAAAQRRDAGGRVTARAPQLAAARAQCAGDRGPRAAPPPEIGRSRSGATATWMPLREKPYRASATAAASPAVGSTRAVLPRWRGVRVGWSRGWREDAATGGCRWCHLRCVSSGTQSPADGADRRLAQPNTAADPP